MSKTKQYQQIVLRLESTADKCGLLENHRRLHGLIGLQTEVGELADILKRRIWYGKILTEKDQQHLLEECGDVLFYLTLLIDACGGTIEDVIDRNVAKLNLRYKGGKFSPEEAIKRSDKKLTGEE